MFSAVLLLHELKMDVLLAIVKGSGVGKSKVTVLVKIKKSGLG